MLKIEKYVTASPEQWEIIIEGMRNPMNSWDKMDSEFNPGDFYMGDLDHYLMVRLADGGPVHAKYRRMIPVWFTVTAPLYWYKEMDTYKVGTVCNSCSTMHKIHEKPFTMFDFSCDHLEDMFLHSLQDTVKQLNNARTCYLAAKEEEKPLVSAKDYWWQMIQLLPSSYNQKRTYMMNYEVLHNIYHSRKNHKLDEWHTFCEWIESLPYADLITGNLKCQ